MEEEWIRFKSEQASISKWS